jgi:hypothetical protein
MAHLSSPANFAIGFWFIIMVTEVLYVVRGTEHMSVYPVCQVLRTYSLVGETESMLTAAGKVRHDRRAAGPLNPELLPRIERRPLGYCPLDWPAIQYCR